MYALTFLSAAFVGTTFFSSGAVASFLSFSTGFLILVCALSISIRKGLVVNKNISRGYFLFGKLLFKKKIKGTISENFTMLDKRYRQKYIGRRRERNLSYTIDSFELYFFDSDGAIRDRIIKCMKLEACDKAKDFLVENASLKFVSLQ